MAVEASESWPFPSILPRPPGAAVTCRDGRRVPEPQWHWATFCRRGTEVLLGLGLCAAGNRTGAAWPAGASLTCGWSAPRAWVSEDSVPGRALKLRCRPIVSLCSESGARGRAASVSPGCPSQACGQTERAVHGAFLPMPAAGSRLHSGHQTGKYMRNKNKIQRTHCLVPL